MWGMATPMPQTRDRLGKADRDKGWREGWRTMTAVCCGQVSLVAGRAAVALPRGDVGEARGSRAGLVPGAQWGCWLGGQPGAGSPCGGRVPSCRQEVRLLAFAEAP